MSSIQIGNRSVTYSVRRSKRSTVRIKVAAPDQLEISAPFRLTDQAIEALLHTKEGWLTKHLSQLEKAASHPLNHELREGSQLPYLGRALTLEFSAATTSRGQVRLIGNILHISLPAAVDQSKWLDKNLREWFIDSARTILTEKTGYWAAEIGVRPERIFIREQKTRWGSCSSRRNINYNWRIIMAPPPIIDYLVVHELSHIKMPNHSRDFWLLVGQSIPDYKECRKWLRHNGRLLALPLAPP